MRRLLLLLALSCFALVPSGAMAQSDDSGVVIDRINPRKHPTVTMEVTVPASVSDRTLPPESFTVKENGEAKAVSVSRIAGDQLDVVMLMDTTGSMGGAPIDEAKTAAARFLQQLPAGTSVAVLGYDTETTVLSDFSAETGGHVGAIAELTADGETALYDAVMTSLDQFGDRKAEHRAVVLLTDGEDNASRTKLDAAVGALKGSGVTLYGIEYRTAYTDQAGLGQLVAATDGRVVRAGDPKGLRQVYTGIAAELSNHYTLTYRSSAEGETTVKLLVAAGEGVATAASAVELPQLPAAAAPAPAPSPVPATPSGGEIVTLGLFATRTALLVGTGAIFLALVIVALALISPGRTRVRMAGDEAGRRGLGDAQAGLTAVTRNLAQSAERALEKGGRRNTLANRLEQAGIHLRPGEFAVAVIFAALVAGIVLLVASGVLVAVVGVVAIAVGSRLYVNLKVQRRRAAFSEQMADTLQLMAGSLRAGYGLMQAIDTVVREAPDPTREEFRRLLVETRLGRDLEVALAEMAARMELDDFAWVVQALGIHREVGGDLAAVLDSITDTVRERDTVRRQIKVLGAEGKLSMYILLALPIVTALGVSVTQPGYVDELFGHPVGRLMIVAGIGFMTAGGLWIRRISRLVF